jgi:cytochrome b
MQRACIWSLPTRLFHWLLAFSVVAAYLAAEAERLLDFHVALGILAGALLLFRIVWGFSGVRYSAFREFELSLPALKTYLLNPFAPKKSYAGHNPAASWAVIAMIALGLAAMLTGFLAYGTQEGRGIFAFLNHGWFRKMELFEALHEATANLLMAVVALHVAGVLLDRLLHKEVGTMTSIFDGHKRIEAKSVRLNIFQKLLAVLGLGACVLLFVYVLIVPGNPLIASVYQPIDYQSEHREFYDECIACHTLYPPFLLPVRSWEVMMGELENHFGDDASLDEAVRGSILGYLKAHAAETSPKEAAYLALVSLNETDKTVIAYTDTPYWKKRHNGIDPGVFKTEAVKSKANCKACHRDMEKGMIEDTNILQATSKR